MSLTTLGSEPQPSLAWTFQSSNVDYVTNLAPSSQVSPGPGQLLGSAALTNTAPTSNTAVYFPGTAGSYMNLGTSSPTEFNIGSSNLFVETWMYINSIPTNYAPIIANGPTGLGSSQENWGLQFVAFTAKPAFFSNNKSVASTITPSLGTWVHIAASYNTLTSTAYIFVNGAAAGSVSGVITRFRTGITVIGIYPQLVTSQYSNMYIRDLRVVQGGVVPVATFTPLASAPFSYASPTYVANMGTTVFTLLGQFVTYPSGKYGSAISVVNRPVGSGNNSNAYLYWTTSSRLSGITVVSGVTMTAWVNFYILPTSGECSVFYITSGGTGQIGLVVNPTTVYWKIGDGAGNYYTGSSTSYPVVGTWYHYTITASNGTAQLYINGALAASSVASYPLSSTWSLNNTYIGSIVTYGPTSALYDDLRIYNTALTAAQVQSIYTQGGAPASSFRTVPQPALAWQFESSNVDSMSSLAPSASGISAYTTGKYQQGFSFNNPVSASDTPTHYLVYTLSPLGVQSSQGFSFSFWFKQTDKTCLSSYQALVGWTSTTGSYYFDPYISPGPNGTIGFYGQNPSGSGLGLSIPSSINTVIGTWYHVTFVVRAGTHTMYVNGNQYGTGTYPNEYTLNQFMVSRTGQYNGHAFAGTVDDLRIYNQALSAAQVQSIYRAQGMPSRGVQQIVPNNDKNLIFYTPFNDSVTDMINNLSPNAGTMNAITTVNASYFTTGKYSNCLVLRNPYTQGLASNTIAYSLPLNNTNGVTLSIWVKWNSWPVAGGLQRMTIMRYAQSANGSLTIWLDRTTETGQTVINWLYAEYSGLPSGNKSFSSTQSISLGTWYNFSYVLKPDSTPLVNGTGSGTVFGYFNGVSVGSVTYSNNFTYTTQSVLALGSIPSNPGYQCIDGFIDECKIYNYPLTASQISSIYASTTPYKTIITGTPLFSQLSTAARSSSVGAFSLRAVNGTSAKAVAVQAHPVVQWPPVAMTSNTTAVSGQLYGNGTYVASSSNGCVSINQAEFKAFDYNISSYWEENYPLGGSYLANTGALLYPTQYETTVSGAVAQGNWLQIQLPTSIILRNYTIVPRTTFEFRCPGTFWIAGSTNGTTWSNVHFQSGITGYTNPVGISFTIPVTSNSVAYSYYRLIVNKTVPLGYNAGTTILNIASWNLYGDAPSYAPNPAQDFYADRLGNLLTAPVTGTTLARWLGGATGYVTKWYDQSGRGNDATQNTAANQPIIQRATKGPGYMCLYSGSQGLTFGAYDILNNTNYTTCGVVRRTSSIISNYYLSGNGGVNQQDRKLHSGYRTSTQLTLAHFADDTNLTVPSFLTSLTEPIAYNYMMVGTGLSGRLYSYSSGTLYSTTRTYAGYLNHAVGTTFSIGGGFNSFTGEIYELLVFTSSLYDLDGTASINQIYQNQLSLYGA